MYIYVYMNIYIWLPKTEEEAPDDWAVFDPTQLPPYLSIYLSLCACIYIYTYIHIYIYIYIYIHIHIYIYTYICLYIHIYIYVHTDIHGDLEFGVAEAAEAVRVRDLEGLRERVPLVPHLRGLVCKAHRLFYHSILGLRVTNKQRAVFGLEFGGKG